jgi:glycosyltransferase involved in cell wall biosynthesis
MISVVIPLYNKAQSIRKTLDSVLAQTYKDFEIVVVDDGSTDESANIAEAMLRECKVYGVECRGKVIRKANGGVSSARNAGILAAKGEYVAFLDGDDLWHSEYLETLHQLIEEYPDAALYGIGCTTINGDKIPEDVIPTTLRGELEDVWNNYPGYWTGSSSSSRRMRLIEIGLFDTKMTHGEDIDMWWRLLLSGKGVFDSRVLAYYRQDTENRAMNKLIPLEKHIPYFVDKYAEARANNVDFRRYFDREMIYRLYPYMFDAHYRKDAKRIAKQMDYSLQKWTMKFRMVYPTMYRMYEKLKGKP